MYKSVKSYSLNLKLKKKKETGKKYRIPLNKNNKHKEEPMEAQSYQKTEDTINWLSSCINNYSKCKWAEFTNKKA